MLSRVPLFVVLALGSVPVATYGQDLNDFVIVTQTPNGPIIDPADNPHLQQKDPSQEEQELIEVLSQVENLGTESEKLVELVGEAKSLDKLATDLQDRVEVAILAWTRPLPASNVEGNLAGYKALANLRPDNLTYATKRDGYTEKLEQLRTAVLKRYKTKTDDFNGVVWYTHRNVPRFADIRPYVALYLGQKGSDLPILRFVLHYTTRNGWLFVESAQANIDGQIVTIPSSAWKRDNDTETWEWIDEYAPGTSYMEISRRIASSSKTVIRFFGQQNRDDYTVRAEDKEILRDGLLAYEVMLEQKDQ